MQLYSVDQSQEPVAEPYALERVLTSATLVGGVVQSLTPGFESTLVFQNFKPNQR